MRITGRVVRVEPAAHFHSSRMPTTARRSALGVLGDGIRCAAEATIGGAGKNIVAALSGARGTAAIVVAHRC